ncbi:Histidine-rich glycoprotein [Actinidia chinensis var. chinensis]|uniref:Histidine-rich glycoprotein n=1 Tax=Actinidia chinensis var. chinensis TaxID=1590841 RepID=A0A2R6Q0H3_ACTCC|nr:Histidine-rich glycoprotein [Actinidia chinensis var. chinensis]
MMIQALNPASNTAKTAEIMSRYRPIAPKPEVANTTTTTSEGSCVSQKIRQSPYLRNVWPHLQARPTRTRKRGRTSLAPLPPAAKRPRTQLFGLSSPAKSLSMQGFTHGLAGLSQLPLPGLITLNADPENPAQTPSNLVTLPLLPCPSSLPIMAHQPATTTIPENGIDLNREAEIPEEKDFLQQLQGPVSPGVIAPQPVRPVGSSISVGSINEDLTSAAQAPKKREEVEEEVESEALPAVVSDSNNKVRLANAAYKEMVGQPECSWLDSMVTCSSCKRICGEVMLQFSDASVPVKSNGFSCWVTIEWGSNGKNSSVHTFCDVIRLSCESKDYLFAWRFHTREASESGSNA